MLLRRGLHLLLLGLRVLLLRLRRGEANRRIARQALADQLMNLGGLAMKIGQVAADAEEGDDLQPLLLGDRGRPLAEMSLVLEQELPAALVNRLVGLEESCNAASLGQVHRARLDGSQWVAVKIQYPAMADAVAAELRLTHLLPSLGPVRRWSVDLAGYRRTLAENMARELDYRSEARRQQQFAEGLQVEGLIVPRVHEDFTRARVLVQDWQDGDTLDQASQWSSLERMLIGRCLLMTLFQSLFRLGQVHGDPHQGNYRFQRQPDAKPRVILYDYGCTIPVPETARLALLRLLLDTRAGRHQSLLATYQGLGFDPRKLVRIQAELPLLTQILFRPLLRDEPLDPTQWRIRQPVEALLGERKWWFRSAGPPDLFLLMRAFQGTLRQLTQLQAHLPWWPLLREAAGAERLRRAEVASLPELPADLDRTPSADVATRLRVRIERGDQILQDLTLPAQAALELDQVIPAPVFERIADFDFTRMRQSLLDSQFAPQVLFDQERGSTHYRIWVE